MPISLFSDFEPQFQARPSIEGLIIPISFFLTVHDNVPLSFPGGIANQNETWGGLVEVFKRLATEPFDLKSDAFLYSPTVYRGNRRGKDYATTSALLVVDADDGMQYNTVCDRLREDGLEAMVHTSASNIHGNKFRIIVPLRQPVHVDEQPAAVRAFCRYLDPDWNPDRGKMNAVSLFYVPGTYAAPAVNEFCHLSGAVLDAKDWIDAFPNPEPPSTPRDVPAGEALSGLRRSSAATEKDRRRPLSRSVIWDIDRCDSVRKYEGLGKGEHHRGLYGMIHSIAMSAYNSGYDLTAAELADFAWDKQAEVLGLHPSTSYKRWQIDRIAADAIAEAPSRVPDPYFQRVKPLPGAHLIGYSSPEEMMAEWRAAFAAAARPSAGGSPA